MNKLTTGIYTLQTRINNPSPDRRYKDEWIYASAWEKDWRFLLLEDPSYYTEEGEKLEGTWYRLSCQENRNANLKAITIYQKKDGEVRLCGIDRRQTEALLLLLTQLVPSDKLKDQFEFIFKEKILDSRDYSEEILFALVKRNVITTDDVRALLEEIREDYNLPAPEFDAKWG